MDKANTAPAAVVLDHNLAVGAVKKYPRWMHHKFLEAIRVENDEQRRAALKKGYEGVAPPITANRYLSNWFWDLEDMSAEQLRVYAFDEFGVDLPKEATQDKLFKTVCRLGKAAPQNRNRLVLMAHTIKLNYDETLEEIKRVISGKANGYETETTTMEIIL